MRQAQVQVRLCEFAAEYSPGRNGVISRDEGA